MTINSTRSVIVMCLLILQMTVAIAQNQIPLTIHASDGEPIPGSDQMLDIELASPLSITDSGLISFYGFSLPFSNGPLPTNNRSLFTLSGSGQVQLRRLVTISQATPNLDARIRIIERQFIADDGMINFYASLNDVTTGGNSGIYRLSSSGVLQELAREDKQLGPGQPTLCRFSGLDADAISALNDGSIVFTAATVDADNRCRARNIFRITASGMIETRVSVGDSINNTAAVLESINLNSMVLSNQAGNVLFVGRDSGATSLNWYLLHQNNLIRIDRAFGGDIPFLGLDGMVTLFDSTDNSILGFRPGDDGFSVIVSRGKVLPDSSGALFNIRRIDVNDNNQIVMLIDLTATPGGSGDDRGVYRLVDGELQEVARLGAPAADPNTRFDSFGVQPSIANNGVVVLTASYRLGDQSSFIPAVFMHQPNTGLIEVINRQRFSNGLQINGWSDPTPLNDQGRGAIILRMADGSAQLVTYNSAGTTPQPPPVPAFQINPGVSGTWFDPEQSGHGLVIEVLNGNRLLASWFTFDADGNQAWFGGAGVYSGNSVTLDFNQPLGGRFIPNFDPAQVNRAPWGTATIRFTSCNSGRIEFNSSRPGFGDGSMALTRLTALAGLNCNP